MRINPYKTLGALLAKSAFDKSAFTGIVSRNDDLFKSFQNNDLFNPTSLNQASSNLAQPINSLSNLGSLGNGLGNFGNTNIQIPNLNPSKGIKINPNGLGLGLGNNNSMPSMAMPSPTKPAAPTPTAPAAKVPTPPPAKPTAPAPAAPAATPAPPTTPAPAPATPAPAAPAATPAPTTPAPAAPAATPATAPAAPAPTAPAEPQKRRMVGGMPAEEFNTMASQRRQSDALTVNKSRPPMPHEATPIMQNLQAQRDRNFTSDPTKQYGSIGNPAGIQAQQNVDRYGRPLNAQPSAASQQFNEYVNRPSAEERIRKITRNSALTNDRKQLAQNMERKFGPNWKTADPELASQIENNQAITLE